MTTIAMPYPGKILRDSDVEYMFREISAQYGDGYEQRAPDGINAVKESWTVNWGALTQVEFSALRTSILSVGTWGIITWTPCDDTVQKKFRIKKGSSLRRSRVANGIYKCSIQIEQVFDI
jgi:phage-related protein